MDHLLGRVGDPALHAAEDDAVERLDRQPVRLSGQPAWGEYVRVPVAGGIHLVGIVVIGIAGDRICGITHFGTAIGRYFGLPRTLN